MNEIHLMPPLETKTIYDVNSCQVKNKSLYVMLGYKSLKHSVNILTQGSNF